MTKEEEKIILDEQKRLQEAYDRAQEKYGYTGSQSTFKSMDRYRILIDALQTAITPDARANSIEKFNHKLTDQIQKGRKYINDLVKGKTLPAQEGQKLLDLLRGY